MFKNKKMTGKGHRITTFAFVAGTTGSLFAAGMSFLGSTFPDSVEYTLFGKRRNRYHRRYTHWFIPWLALSLTCFYRSGWIIPRLASLIHGNGADKDVWACAAFWFLGCVLHIIEDSWCGTVPFLFPWKRSFGMHVFKMSSQFGQLSAGERGFIFCVVLLSLIIWVSRNIELINTLYNNLL